MFAREVGPSSEMSCLPVNPPFCDENEEFRSILRKLNIDNSSLELSPKQILKDADGILKFLSNHPMPYYQGPFLCPVGMEMLDKSFRDFTTFKHPDGVNCATLNDDTENLETPKSDLKKQTVGAAVSSEILTLVGPASKLDTTLIYNCDIGQCQISCVCSICNAPKRCTRRSCAHSPCENCDVQCCEHKIGLASLFADDQDLFTLNVKKGEATDKSNIFNQENFGIKKYACIPKTCHKCKEDLKDHQLHHKVIHSRCKFCRQDFRFIKDCMSKNDLRREREDIKLQDDETCSICYKMFANKFARKRHEQGAHGGSSVQCMVCSRTFQSTKTLQKHTDVYHAHQISLFPCSLCKKILSTEEILKRHLVTVHGENKFECHQCGKKYSRNNHYIRHLRDVHSIESKTNLNYAAIEFIYKFNCDHCEQRFKRQETLQRHIKSKHGEQSEEYQCNVCSKKFNRNDNRKRHESGCSM